MIDPLSKEFLLLIFKDFFLFGGNVLEFANY